jgi:hypothetical protein
MMIEGEWKFVNLADAPKFALYLGLWYILNHS